MAVSIDASELDRLGTELEGAVKRLSEGIVATTRKAALNIKNELRDQAQGVTHAPALPSTITFDTRALANGFEARIGPEKGHAGSLALLYFGNSKTGPRLSDPMQALEHEATSYVEFLGRISGASVLP